MSPRFEKHLLICVNERPEGSSKPSCGHCGGAELRLRFTELIKAHGLKGRVRASKTGCLDACELGPVVAIYPADLWYIQVQPEDAEAIFRASILADGVYEPRLADELSWERLREMRSGQSPR